MTVHWRTSRLAWTQALDGHGCSGRSRTEILGAQVVAGHPDDRLARSVAVQVQQSVVIRHG